MCSGPGFLNTGSGTQSIASSTSDRSDTRQYGLCPDILPDPDTPDLVLALHEDQSVSVDRRWRYLFDIGPVAANIVPRVVPVFQLDQLVIDSAMEKRDMEHKHATIQQRVSPNYNVLLFHHSLISGFV